MVRLITADASKVSGASFWRALNQDRFFRRELEREIGEEQRRAMEAGDHKAWGIATRRAIALRCGLPLDHFEKKVA